VSALEVAGDAPAMAWAGQRADSAAPLVLASASWPLAPGDRLPPVAGFVTSSFSPLAAELAERCLHSYFGPPPADPARGGRTAVLLASTSGDLATSAAVAAAVDAGRRVPPLLFYQSNPNAVVGYIAARWGLAGPVVCTMPPADALADAHRNALLLLADGDADAVLIIVAEQAAAGRGDVPAGRGDHPAGRGDHLAGRGDHPAGRGDLPAGHRDFAAGRGDHPADDHADDHGGDHGGDHGVAQLIGPASWPPALRRPGR
jgi:Beta-ketoacyl synthase, N-terminal domain